MCILVRVLVKMVDVVGFERRGTALYAAYFVAFGEHELRGIGAVLAGDAAD
jgi:hypothetical protein